MKNTKKGVSLVTVLLFMLIATIAATGTYKWLTSEGWSSSSRMKLSEARLAADAGLDAARAWMIYNANDVGAVVKQYFDEKAANGSASVKLNNVIKNGNTENQNYDVYLVGVDKQHSTYRMKLVSVGRASNGTKYSEIAILDVNGLYRVRIPGAKRSGGSSGPFQEAIFGGVANQHDMNITSGIVNGNLILGSNSGVTVEKHLIVTGNTVVRKPSKVMGDLYTNGNYISCEGMTVDGNMFIKNEFHPAAETEVKKDLYTAGGTDFNRIQYKEGVVDCMTGWASLTVGRNWSNVGDVKMTMPTENRNKINITGNLVVSGGLVFPLSDAANYGSGGYGYKDPMEFHAKKNVIINDGITGKRESYHIADKVSLGTSVANDKVYVPKATMITNEKGILTPDDVWANYATYQKTGMGAKKLDHKINTRDGKDFWGNWVYKDVPDIPSNVYCNQATCKPSFDEYSAGNYPDAQVFFQINGSRVDGVSEADSAGWGASMLSEYGERIVQEADLDEDGSGCSGPHIEDPIRFNRSLLTNMSVMHSKAHPGACTNFLQWGGSWEELENCYSAAEGANELYEGEWLVVRASNPQWWQLQNKALSHNYIIIVDYTPGSSAELYIPPTGKDNGVIFYFPNGFKRIQETQPLATASNYNYFFFSEKNIDDLMIPYGLNGSIFMAKCSTVDGPQTLNVDFNQDLFDVLTGANVLCGGDNSEDCSSGGGSGEGSSGESSDPEAGMDSYYVANSPQLNLNLVSQYKNNEVNVISMSNNGVDPSVIILPRVIYLTTDAEGKLSDYYSIIPLNGKSPNSLRYDNVECPSEISTSDYLVTESSGPLKNNTVYTCHYKDSDTPDEGIPFYVYVQGQKGANPTIAFDIDEKEIVAGGLANVNLVAPQGDRPVAFRISAPSKNDLPNGWDYTVYGGQKVEDNGVYAVYSFDNITLSGSNIPLFQVSTTTSASQADARFFLEDCEGCNIGSPRSERIFLNGHVNVEREEITASYCGNSDEATGVSVAESFENVYGESCTEVASRADCDLAAVNVNTLWVGAAGQNCVPDPQNKNGLWQCNTGMSISLRSMLQINDFCTAYVADEKLSQMTLNQTYPLHASLKRNPVKLNVELSGKTGSGKVKIQYYRPGITEENSLDDLKACTEDCEANLYAGDVVTLSYDQGTDVFNYWACSGDNCTDRTSPDKVYKTMRLTGSTTVTAYFNKRDMHCVYSDFKNTNAFCNGTEKDCIDYCTSGTNCSAKTGGHNLGSDWILVYANSDCEKISSWTGYCGDYGTRYKHDYFQPPTLNRNDGSSISALNINHGLIGESVDAVAGRTHESQSVVLGRIEAGYDGVMTSVFEVPTIVDNLTGNWFDKTIEDAFILRSTENASEYLALTVISKYNSDRNVGPRGYWTYARLCYASGKNTDKSTCEDVAFKEGLDDDSPILATQLTHVSVSITMDGPRVVANLSYVKNGSSFSSAYAIFDMSTSTKLKTHIMNDKSHQYIGFKLADVSTVQGWLKTNFKIFDIAWRSTTEDYGDECWDTPSVSCSFKANYPDGYVPLNSASYPWVSTSSWFDNKECRVFYYYNGCDIEDNFESGYSPWNRFSSKDACYNDQIHFKWSAKELEAYKHGKLTSAGYVFTEEGLHGYSNGSGFVNDASVAVVCSGTNDVIPYYARCGEFNVGELIQCTESYGNLLSAEGYCAGDDACEPTLNLTGTINVRESRINITISDLTNGNVSVRMVDENGRKSDVAGVAEESGLVSFVVESSLSNENGFNPQKLKGFVFEGENTSGYKVSLIQSSCPNALTMTCNKPVYNVATGEWTISAEVAHPEQADKCKITVLDDAYGVEVPNGSSCLGFNQIVKQSNVYGQDESKSYRFVVSALDEQGNEINHCIASATIPVVSFSECELSSMTVVQGQGVPSLSFDIDGCPSDGCDYRVYYDDEEIAHTLGASETGRCPKGGCNSVNKSLFYDADETHKYVVDAYGVKCEGEFTVTPSSNVVTCSARIEGEKFVADVSTATWTGELAFTDNFGHEVVPTTISVAGDGTHRRFEYALPEGVPGALYQATLMPGGKGCSAQWSVKADNKAEGYLSMGSCENVSGQDPSSSISITPASVIGCDDGKCNLTISPATGEGTQHDYDGSAFYFYDVNATGGSYTATISRPGYASSSCTFTVAFEQSSTEGCNCKCSAEGCKHINTGEVTTNNPSPGCYFTTGEFSSDGVRPVVHAYDGSKVTVNGIDISSAPYNGTAQIYDHHEADGTGSVGNMSGNKVDGGYYIEIKSLALGNGHEFKFFGGTPNCSAGEGSGTGGSGTETSPCSCSNYCSSGCDDLKLSVDDQYNSYSKTTCIFVTKIEGINENWGMNEIKVNNKRPGYCTSESACVNGIGKVDGGYYIQVPNTRGCIVNQTYAGSENGKSCEQVQIVATGGTAPSCSGR